MEGFDDYSVIIMKRFGEVRTNLTSCAPATESYEQRIDWLVTCIPMLKRNKPFALYLGHLAVGKPRNHCNSSNFPPNVTLPNSFTENGEETWPLRRPL